MSETQQPKRGRGLIVGLILTFMAGSMGMAWLLTGTQVGRELVQPKTEAVAIADTVPQKALAEPQVAVNAPIPAMGAGADTAFRLASLEARLASLESRPSSGAGGSSPRVEALLLTLVAGRKLDRGESLGVLEGDLAARFGAMDQAAVGALAAWSAAPVRLSDLQARFEKVAPILSAGDGWWDQLTTNLSSLIIVRDEKSGTSAPAHAVSQARELVQDGQIDAALKLVRTLPKTPEGNRWIGDATRLVNAKAAMGRLEARALDLTAPPSTLSAPAALPAAAALQLRQEPTP